MRFTYTLIIGILSITGWSCEENIPTIQPVDYVDPMIGTEFFGHTFPGATLPYAMVQLSPDNGTDGWTFSSGYAYKENTIVGFSHTHLSGVGYTACGDVFDHADNL